MVDVGCVSNVEYRFQSTLDWYLVAQSLPLLQLRYHSLLVCHVQQVLVLLDQSQLIVLEHSADFPLSHYTGLWLNHCYEHSQSSGLSTDYRRNNAAIPVVINNDVTMHQYTTFPPPLASYNH